MKYFKVVIQSNAYNLCSVTNVLADSAEQAVGLCETKFHESVNNFLRSGHKSCRKPGPYKEIPKDVLLRGADITTELISDKPMVIKSEWGNK